MRLRAVPLALLAFPASALGAQRVSVSGIGELWNDAARRFHGAFIAAYDLTELPGGSAVGAELNTETLRLEYTGLSLAPGLTLNLRATGELLVAGLSRDYFRRGRTLADRTYRASYVQAEAWLKWNVVSELWVEAQLGGRRWFFGRTEETGASFVLPADAFVFEPRLSATWWGLGADAAWADRHRHYPRQCGLAAGVLGALDLRSEAPPWGARELGFVPPDPRNAPASVALRGEQWLRAGLGLGAACREARVRVQLEQSAGFGGGQDDLTRRRIGAMNPYVVQVPGLPWGHYLADRYGGAALSVHLGVHEGLEVGLIGAGALLVDPDRVGADAVGGTAGFGAFVDARLGDWQLDLRGGYSPTLAADSGKAELSVLLAAGWAFAF